MNYTAPHGFFTAFLAALIVTAISAEQGCAEGIRVDAVKIPVSGSSGSAFIELESIVVRPDDGLPHPLAVLNHGSPEMRATVLR
jgi:hypothetical protein